ncbi:MAG: ABC transporter permease [Anaerolineaceae bacterium]|jgi:simple sugar transport system permease protein|nr:ABC transporter permease [Anaerolineaceae bacterium]
MNKTRTRSSSVLFQLGGLVFSLLFVSLILILVKSQPLEAFRLIWEGATGNATRISSVFVVWVPLVLVTCGLLATFTAGLWNIGIEGQITVGAIFTTGAIRLFLGSSLSPVLVIIISILVGMIGGAVWAALAGVLKTFGGVNEIFGGLGLNFIATALNIGLIFGAWSRPGVASMSGTEPFPEQFWLPTFQDFRVSLWSIAFAIIGLVIIYFLLQGTHFGLRLKAVGKGMKSAFRMGIPTWQHMMLSFIICGLFAGLAGALQVTAVYHRLIPAISSGYGFMGLMIAMLINYQAIWLAPIALFFAALNIGGIQLPIVLKLDSSLTGVLQGSLVLFVMISQGIKQKFLGKK